MVTVIINDLAFLVKSNVSILEACKYVGVYIPRFCYHETLSVAGNCRMCLVEVNELEKPVASCVTLVQDGMEINTDTMFVKKARENVVEALLINHPLDCPICDQAGECDLQDQTKLFGSSHSRFFFNKRGVEDKDCGPLIKTIMTRCIHCTRCVRFGTEIAGLDYLGTLNRGTSTEIGGYVSKMFSSEISGNVIDLCPVGALTSKPYAFKARPWELRITENIDLMDGLGSNLYVSFKETEIVRITPKSNSHLNDNIISDKARFSYDFLKLNRIKNVYSKRKIFDKNFSKSSWKNIFEYTDSNLKTNDIKSVVLVNSELDLKTMLTIKSLENAYPNSVRALVSDSFGNSTNFFLHNFDNSIEIFNVSSDSCFFISVNPKIECAIINAKLRMKYKRDFFTNYAIGPFFNSGNMPVVFLNLGKSFVTKFLEGKITTISKIFLSSKNPIVLLGENLDPLFSAVLKNINQTAKLLTVCNTSNFFGAKYVNFKANNSKDLNKNSNLLVVNHDDTLKTRRYLNPEKSLNSFWLNTHGSKVALKYENILPTLTGFEHEEIHMNLEKRIQKTASVIKNSTDARNCQITTKALFDYDDSKTQNASSFDYISEMLKKQNLFDKSQNVFATSKLSLKDCYKMRKMYFYPIKSKKEDFYCSNRLSKNSLIMSNCSSIAREECSNFIL